jgi:hypothetical protein
MNAMHLSVPSAPRTPVAVPAQNGSVPHSARYRERDFGIGYGASSGYARDRRYTSDWAPARFRCG